MPYYMSPYIDISKQQGYPCFERISFNGFNVRGWFSYYYKENTWRCNGTNKTFSSEEEAKKYLDDELIRLGWEFITEKRAEKLKLLL